jgi:formyl-CoA transferase
MIEASVSFMPDSFTAYTQAGRVMEPETRPAFSLGLVFRCADERMLATQGSSIEKFWYAMLEAIGRTELAQDARFRDRPGRVENFQALIEELRPVFAAKPRAHWMECLARHDVPNAPVHTIPEALADPEVRHLGLFHEVEHSRYGKTTAMRRAVRIDGERETDPLPPPALGEHTDTVLRELGFEQGEIEELRRAKVI